MTDPNAAYTKLSRPDAGIPFSEAPSVIPDDPNRACQRVDPYWASIWGVGSNSSWSTRDSAAYQHDSGLAALPSQLAIDTDAAWHRIAGSGRNQWKRLSAMSALDTWRTLTGEQIAAISGAGDIADGIPGTLADLFSVGLADVGMFSNGLVGIRANSRGHLYRPSRTKVYENEVRPRLTWAERVSVTAGLPWESGSQFDRHNVLTAELALRVAEWCEIGTVLGEKLSKWSMLAFEGAGLPPRPGTRNAADATLVRTDGARIAIELTASTNQQFFDKVRGWAALLSDRRMADTGLAVVFVIAHRPDGLVRPGLTKNKIRSAIAAAVRDFPGVDFDRTASRIFVADWLDWFPAPYRVAPGFFTLEAQRATGPTTASRWETASALDVFDLPFEPADRPGWDPMAVINNTQSLRAVPHWLRDVSKAKEVWSEPIKAMGFRGIPVPPPSRPESFKGGALGAGVGSAGDARPPLRLLLQGS